MVACPTQKSLDEIEVALQQLKVAFLEASSQLEKAA